MASGKGALQQVASLSRSSGGLLVHLMKRVAVAAVTSVAIYGSGIRWRGQKDRLRRLQLLLNSQAMAMTVLLKSTPLAFFQQRRACLALGSFSTIAKPDMLCALSARTEITRRISSCLRTSVSANFTDTEERQASFPASA